MKIISKKDIDAYQEEANRADKWNIHNANMAIGYVLAISFIAVFVNVVIKLIEMM